MASSCRGIRSSVSQFREGKARPEVSLTHLRGHPPERSSEDVSEGPTEPDGEYAATVAK